VNAKFLSLILHFPTPFPAGGATEAARRLVAAMPAANGLRAEPESAMDADLLARPIAEDFESNLIDIALQNAGVAPSWSITVSYLPLPGAGATLQLACGFWPDVRTVWPYLVVVANATTEALRPSAATLGGLDRTANRAATLKEVPVPRVFAPWTYVALDRLPPALAIAIRALPDAAIRHHADGVIIEAVRDPYGKPTPRFVHALEALAITPPASWRQVRFPTRARPV
jgi:hypothetical protein